MDGILYAALRRVLRFACGGAGRTNSPREPWAPSHHVHVKARQKWHGTSGEGNQISTVPSSKRSKRNRTKQKARDPSMSHRIASRAVAEHTLASSDPKKETRQGNHYILSPE
mmetsp:Transcript_20381/g.47805  ORF Transcript_20381/g.47805 Transcript_20381/m.47805 type:complete len:112 (-) Transcript_20381:226-561(-)